MADPREKMVFNLEIQSTQAPGHKLTPSREIGGGLDLVDGPLVLNFNRLQTGN